MSSIQIIQQTQTVIKGTSKVLQDVFWPDGGQTDAASAGCLSHDFQKIHRKLDKTLLYINGFVMLKYVSVPQTADLQLDDIAVPF